MTAIVMAAVVGGLSPAVTLAKTRSTATLSTSPPASTSSSTVATTASTTASTPTTPTTPTAVTTPALAQPTFVATSPVLTFGGNKTWTTTVEILDPGPTTTVGLELILRPQCTSVATTTAVTLNGDGVTSVPLRFTGPKFDARSLSGATLVLVPAAQTIPATGACQPAATTLTTAASQTVASPAAGTPTGTYTPAPATITLTLSRITPVFAAILLPIFVGLGLAALAILSILATLLVRRGWRPGSRAPVEPDVAAEPWLPPRISAGSTWNFKDSFATNATAIGGLFGAALSAAGSSSTLLPGVETSRFVLLSALWGAVAVVVPLILSFATRNDPMPIGQGSAVKIPATSVGSRMLLFCLFLTVLAAGAELMTFAVLASDSATAHLAIYLCLMGLALLLAGYVVWTTVSLIISQADDSLPHTALNHFRNTSLVG